MLWNSARCRKSTATWILVAITAAGLVAPTVDATPLTWGDDVKKPQAWPKNSTLNVFVQTDPDNAGRGALAKVGIERWTKTLSDRMITLVVTIGDPPAQNPPANSIRYTWEADGTELAGLKLGSGPNDNAGIGAASSDGTTLTGGQAVLRRALPSATDAEKDFVRNLAEHEMTHILGLADDEKGEVTDHSQPSTSRNTDDMDNQQLNDQDKKEINTLYGTVRSGGDKKPKAKGTKTAGGGGAGFFTYRFDFQPTDPIQDATDPEHVSLITIGVAPALVTSIVLPAGWVALPADTSDPNASYFSENYMLDGAPTPPPWASGHAPSFLVMRTSVAQAAIDGVPAGVDPGLSFDTPSIEITLLTVGGVVEGPIDVWAGDQLQTVSGPLPSGSVPTLSGWGMTLLTLLLMATGALLMRRRRSAV